MTLDEFAKKLKEFATNNISAMEGNIQLTANEVSELRLEWMKLPAADRTSALEMVNKYKVDTRDWK
ncbi:MAG: hypothetical protein QM723_36795 [Myxococcaceae bacterium]